LRDPWDIESQLRMSYNEVLKDSSIVYILFLYTE